LIGVPVAAAEGRHSRPVRASAAAVPSAHTDVAVVEAVAAAAEAGNIVAAETASWVLADTVVVAAEADHIALVAVARTLRASAAAVNVRGVRKIEFILGVKKPRISG
jgi:hypothetical protein